VALFQLALKGGGDGSISEATAVIIAAFARGFLRISVFGDVNVGLRLGVVQVHALTGIGAERGAR
jgi:hypothetical protein